MSEDKYLGNFLEIIHDNDLSTGDRLQRLSSRINGIMRGEDLDKYPDHLPRITEQLSSAAADVLIERQRQQEWFTPEQDDRYNECQLACAASTYALCTEPEQLKLIDLVVWPWHRGWWKPKDYRRNLVKAAALLLAEIERIDRKEAKEKKV